MADENQNMATLLGYEDVELSREINGKKSVRVKCLPVRKFAEFAALMAIEVELLAIVTDLTAEQIDMLTPEDSGKIYLKALELNVPPFSAWVDRKRQAITIQEQVYKTNEPTSGKSFANS